MAKQVADQDRNFDGLVERFNKNVYGGLKGAIRLAVLQRDFNLHLPFVSARAAGQKPLRILDAGGGQGQFSLQLARAGHELVICDISAEMLAQAQTEVLRAGLNDSVTLVHGSLGELPLYITDCQFDVVLCHAVMEWMAEPEKLLPCLQMYLKPDGHLSLTYYNRNALVYKNLLRGNFTKVIAEDFGGARGSLTPIHPMDPTIVATWVEELNFSVVGRSGIRVFHDYIFDAKAREHDHENLIALELEFSQQEPFWLLGRYIHLILNRNILGANSSSK
jgi:S-adenosylmethionine-dependent methyltransferase